MKVKKIIVREGLILLAITIILYFSFSFLCQKIPAVFPKYRAEFMNGKIYTMDIYPDYHYSMDKKRFMQEFYHPNPKLVEKRFNELAKRENINSPLKEAKLINAHQVYFSELLFNILSLNLSIKVAAVYFLLLAMRFLIWAIRMLKEA